MQPTLTFSKVQLGNTEIVFTGETNFAVRAIGSTVYQAQNNAHQLANDSNVQKQLIINFAKKIVGQSPVADLVQRNVMLNGRRFILLDQQATEVMIVRVVTSIFLVALLCRMLG